LNHLENIYDDWHIFLTAMLNQKVSEHMRVVAKYVDLPLSLCLSRFEKNNCERHVLHNMQPIPMLTTLPIDHNCEEKIGDDLSIDLEENVADAEAETEAETETDGRNREGQALESLNGHCLGDVENCTLAYPETMPLDET
jgi:hypothetical protein